MDHGEQLLRNGQHRSLDRDIHEGDEGSECPRSRCVVSVCTLTGVDEDTRAELNPFLVFWIKEILEAVSCAGLILVLHCNSGVVEEYHSYHTSALHQDRETEYVRSYKVNRRRAQRSNLPSFRLTRHN